MNSTNKASHDNTHPSGTSAGRSDHPVRWELLFWDRCARTPTQAVPSPWCITSHNAFESEKWNFQELMRQDFPCTRVFGKEWQSSSSLQSDLFGVSFCDPFANLSDIILGTQKVTLRVLAVKLSKLTCPAPSRAECRTGFAPSLVIFYRFLSNKKVLHESDLMRSALNNSECQEEKIHRIKVPMADLHK